MKKKKSRRQDDQQEGQPGHLAVSQPETPQDDQQEGQSGHLAVSQPEPPQDDQQEGQPGHLAVNQPEPPQDDQREGQPGHLAVSQPESPQDDQRPSNVRRLIMTNIIKLVFNQLSNEKASKVYLCLVIIVGVMFLPYLLTHFYPGVYIYFFIWRLIYFILNFKRHKRFLFRIIDGDSSVMEIFIFILFGGFPEGDEDDDEMEDETSNNDLLKMLASRFVAATVFSTFSNYAYLFYTKKYGYIEVLQVEFDSRLTNCYMNLEKQSMERYLVETGRDMLCILLYLFLSFIQS